MLAGVVAAASVVAAAFYLRLEPAAEIHDAGAHDPGAQASAQALQVFSV